MNILIFGVSDRLICSYILILVYLSSASPVLGLVLVYLLFERIKYIAKVYIILPCIFIEILYSI